MTLEKIFKGYVERKVYLILIFDVLIPQIWNEWIKSGQLVLLGIILIIVLIIATILPVIYFIVKIWPYVVKAWEWVQEKIENV